ncbi:MAG: phosphate signaling complex protein PhoU [Candidatus Bathyarchaeota archaeon]|nr:phosphate signaling complex protein PhoU [Candidatus Bathyarchaeota archaeon]
MSRLLDTGLEQLTVMVYKMGEIAEKTVGISLNGFMHGKDTTQEVKGLSEVLLALTVEIEEKAFALIAKYQPVASDLRIINSYMKIAYDFERYGRYAWDISLTHKRFSKLENCALAWGPMKQLMKKVTLMVSKSTKALKNLDAEVAKSLAEDENKVDELFFKYLDHLAESPTQTKCALCNLLVARFLERIADHTTYVGEAIIYIATGKKAALR